MTRTLERPLGSPRFFFKKTCHCMKRHLNDVQVDYMCLECALCQWAGGGPNWLYTPSYLGDTRNRQHTLGGDVLGQRSHGVVRKSLEVRGVAEEGIEVATIQPSEVVLQCVARLSLWAPSCGLLTRSTRELLEFMRGSLLDFMRGSWVYEGVRSSSASSFDTACEVNTCASMSSAGLLRFPEGGPYGGGGSWAALSLSLSATLL